MSARTIDHPVFVRAREAARARTDLRISRLSPRLSPPVKRLSNAPVLLRDPATVIGTPDGAQLHPAAHPSVHPAAHPAPHAHLHTHPPAPSPDAPTDRPPAPPPAAPDVIDLPPAEKPQPISEPPALVQARHTEAARSPSALA